MEVGGPARQGGGGRGQPVGAGGGQRRLGRAPGERAEAGDSRFGFGPEARERVAGEVDVPACVDEVGIVPDELAEVVHQRGGRDPGRYREGAGGRPRGLGPGHGGPQPRRVGGEAGPERPQAREVRREALGSRDQLAEAGQHREVRPGIGRHLAPHVRREEGPHGLLAPAAGEEVGRRGRAPLGADLGQVEPEHGRRVVAGKTGAQRRRLVREGEEPRAGLAAARMARRQQGEAVARFRRAEGVREGEQRRDPRAVEREVGQVQRGEQGFGRRAERRQRRGGGGDRLAEVAAPRRRPFGLLHLAQRVAGGRADGPARRGELAAQAPQAREVLRRVGRAGRPGQAKGVRLLPPPHDAAEGVEG